jgi:hypothetical protein
MLNIAVFGEAERGKVFTPYCVESLESLLAVLGNPPEDSFGINIAIQALLYRCNLIFFRVTREGYSVEDYMQGLRYLEDRNKIRDLHGLAIPGVGDSQIIDETKKICSIHSSILIITEKDLYDYLTSFPIEKKG